MQKTWVVGDVHGCYNELLTMISKLKKAGLNCNKDQVVFLGDYIDRGAYSKKVIEQLIKWRKRYPHWVFLLGNHEDIFLDYLFDHGKKYGYGCWFLNGGKKTYENYGGHFGKGYEFPKGIRDAFPPEHLEFLMLLKPYYEDEKYLYVHAGFKPKVEIDKQKIMDLLWIRDEFIESDYDFGKKVIFGHSPAYKSKWGKFGKPIIMKNKIGLDGAVCPPANANLLAIELPSEKIYKVKSYVQ